MSKHLYRLEIEILADNWDEAFHIATQKVSRPEVLKPGGVLGVDSWRLFMQTGGPSYSMKEIISEH